LKINYISINPLNKFFMANSIQYFLIPNYLTADPNDQFARVSSRNVLSIEDIIERCLNRGTTLTRTDITAVANLFMDETMAAVAEGNNVNLPLVNIRPSITGIFNSKSDLFDNSRHTIRATLSMGNGLGKAMEEARTEKIQEPVAAPFLLEYVDSNSNTANTTLTPAGIGTLIGAELKFDPANANEGIFFVPVVAGADVKVAVISSRTEGKLVFQVPAALAAGNYRVEVRRGYTSSKTIRTGELSEVLTVN
jgi:hypothetical protein